ncbi:MAG: hypothetical protein AB7G12_16405 [Thermoanaerobaculia bacterium]
MPRRLLPAVAAFVVLAACFLAGVLFFLRPILDADSPGGPLVPRGAGFFLSILLYILLYVWVEKQMGDAMKAAVAIALAQLLLVDVDFVLSGERGVAAGAASALLLLVSWTATGFVYGRLTARNG